jgi:hypothetical protein
MAAILGPVALAGHRVRLRNNTERGFKAQYWIGQTYRCDSR